MFLVLQKPVRLTLWAGLIETHFKEGGLGTSNHSRAIAKSHLAEGQQSVVNNNS